MTVQISLQGYRSGIGSISLPPPIVDQELQVMAAYMKESLNYVFDPIVIVKTAADYNVFDVPLQGYPLLKVYRVSDQVLPNTCISSTTINIDHCMSYIRQSNIGAFATVVGNVMKLALIEPNDTGIKIDLNAPITISYNTTFSENYEPIMQFVTATCNIYTSAV